MKSSLQLTCGRLQPGPLLSLQHLQPLTLPEPNSPSWAQAATVTGTLSACRHLPSLRLPVTHCGLWVLVTRLACLLQTRATTTTIVLLTRRASTKPRNLR
jgi:hypothetical protein